MIYYVFAIAIMLQQLRLTGILQCCGVLFVLLCVRDSFPATAEQLKQNIVWPVYGTVKT